MITNWFASIELLISEILILEASCKHSEGWLYNFESKNKDTSLVLHQEGFARDHLFGVVKRESMMKETQLKILRLVLAVLASYYTRKL